MTNSSAHPFDRSGIASLSDLQSEEWRSLYELLEKDQDEFLSMEGCFRSPEYRWPRDPLHTWSRVWEYPYVYHHLRHWRGICTDKSLLRVVDLGSGVTFFPFSIARLGCHATCVDIDPVVAVDLPKAAKTVDHHPGRVDYRQSINSQLLPFADQEVDAVYSISVLEHVPEFERLIAEVARVLKPAGLFVLTVDLDMRGDQAIGVGDYGRLRRCLHEWFEYNRPVVTVHPLNMLSSDTGPFSRRKSNILPFLVRESIRRLMGRQPNRRPPFRLTVEGMVLKRRKEHDPSTHRDIDGPRE